MIPRRGEGGEGERYLQGSFATCSFKNSGECDFSDKKLQETVGIKPQKLAEQRDTFLGVAKRAELQVSDCT